MVQAVSKRQIRGFATLAFTLPEKVDTDEIDVKVTGKLGDFSEDADGRFRVNHFSNVSLSTDKPIYQPGQTLHTRLMAFGVNKKAIAGQPVILKILDPEETLVTRIELQTSPFGIAAADWQILISFAWEHIGFKQTSEKAAMRIPARQPLSKSADTSFRLLL